MAYENLLVPLEDDAAKLKAAEEAAGRYDPHSTDPTKAVRTTSFLADVREFYRERDGKELGSDDEALRYFFSDRRWKDANIPSLAKELVTAGSMSTDQQRRLANLQTVFERYPFFWQEGGRGWVEGLSENTLASLADPTNLIPGAAAGKVAFKAARAGLSAPVMRGIGKAAVTDAAVNAAASGVADVASQARDREIGISDSYKPEQTAVAMGIGGGFGAVVGGAVGSVGAVAGARKGAAELAAEQAAKAAANPPAPPAGVAGPRQDQPPMPTLLDRMRVGYRDAVDAEADVSGVQTPDPNSENLRRLATLDTLALWPETKARMLAETAKLDVDAQIAQQAVIKRYDSLYNRLSTAATEAEAERILDSAPPPVAPEGAAATAPQPPAAAAAQPAPAPVATEGVPPAAADQTPASQPAASAEATSASSTAAETPPAAETIPELSRDDALTALEQSGIDRKEAGARLRSIAEQHKGDRTAEGNVKRRQAYAKAVEVASAEAEIKKIRDDAYSVALDVFEADKSGGQHSMDEILDLVSADMADDMRAAWTKYAEATGRTGEEPSIDALFRGKVAELTAGISGQAEARKALDEAIAKEADAAARTLPLAKRKPFIDFVTKKLQVDLFDDGVAAGRPAEQQLRHIKASIWSRADAVNLREDDIPTPDPKRGVQDSGPREGGESQLADQVANAPPNALRTGRETIEAPIIDRVLARTDPVTGEEIPVEVSGRSLRDVVETDPAAAEPGQSAFRRPGAIQQVLKPSNSQGFAGPTLVESRRNPGHIAGEKQLVADAERGMAEGRSLLKDNQGGQVARDAEATDAPYRIKLPSFAAAADRADLNVGVSDIIVRREINPNVDSGLRAEGKVVTAAAEDATPISVAGAEGSPQLQRRYLLADKSPPTEKNPGGLALYAAPGDEVWLDPKTGKVYKNHPSGTEPPAAAVRPTPTPEAAAVSRALESGDKAQAADLTKALVAARRKAAGLPSGTTSNTVPAAAAAKAGPVSGELPEGMWVAIRSKENGHTRVLSPNQAAAVNNYEAGPKTLAGRKPLDEFEIGHAPAGSKSGYDVAFTSRDGGAPVEPKQKVRDPQQVVKPASFEAVKDHPIKVGDETISAGDLHARVAELESKSLADLDTATVAINQLEAMLPVLPDLRLPTTSRARAIRQVEYKMRFAGPETIGAAKDILARLGGGGDIGPKIRKGDADGHVAASSNPKHLNTVRLRPQEIAADGPALTRLVHELAHWSWTNLVQPADKLAFVRYIKNTYLSSQAGLEAFHARVARGTDKSVAELWANQFEAYVAQRFRGGAYSAFWEKHAEAAKHLLDRMVNPKSNFLDQRLAEDFFAKLLPDEVLERMTDRLAGAKEAKTETGKKLQVLHARYLMLADMVEDALAAGDVATLREVLVTKNAGDGAMHALYSFARKSGTREAGLRAKAKQLNAELYQWNGERMAAEKAGPQAGDLTAEGIATRDKAVDDQVTVFGGRAMAVLRDIVADYERAFADVESGAKPAVAEAPVRGEAKARAENAREGKRAQARAKVKRDAVVAEAKTELTQKPKAAAASPAKPVSTPSPRAATDDELAGAMASMPAGSPERRQVAREVVRRENAQPVRPAGEPSLEASSLSNAALFRSLADALDIGDPKRTTELYLELADRGFTTPLQAKSAKIQHALAGETRAHDGLAYQDGLAPRGPATLQNLQSMIRAKTPEVEAAARTMLERAWRLLNANLRADLGETELFDLASLHRLAGTPIPAGAVGGFGTIETFSPLRGHVRRTAIALVEGAASPVAAMHEIAHLAMRTLPDETRAFVLDAFGRADDAVKTRVIDVYKHLPPQEQADEWFADSFAKYLSERVAKEQVWQHNLAAGQFDVQLKGWLERLLDEVKEMVAYLTNGLIGNQNMKQVFRQLTWYGDMFASSRPTQRPTAVPAGDATAHGRRIASAMSTERRKAIEQYVGSAFDQDRDGPLMLFHATPLSKTRVMADDFIFEPSPFGNIGPGIYLSDAPDGASYGDQMTFGAWRKLIENAVASNRLTETQASRAFAAARGLVDRERELVGLLTEREAMRGLDDEAPAPYGWQEEGEAVVTAGEARNIINRSIPTYQAIIDENRAVLNDFKVVPDGHYVAPVFVRAEQPLDLRYSALYSAGDLRSPDTQIGRLIQALAGPHYERMRPYIDELVDTVRSADADVPDLYLSGRDVQQHILSTIAKARMAEDGTLPEGKTPYFAIGAMVNKAARNIGYDAIAATERRMVLDQGQAVRAVDYDAFTLFSPNQIKHAEAKVFDPNDPRLMYAIDTNLAGGLGEHMIEAGAPDPAAGVKIQHALDLRAVPGEIGRLVDGILGKKGGASSLATADSLSGIQIRENSSRIRKFVSGWIADKVKPLQGAGHYEQIDESFAAKTMPIFDALEKLPDGAAWKQGLREMKFWGELPQSRSDAKILHTLRRWDDPAARNALSPDELRVAEQIMGEFKREWDRLSKAGIVVGRVDNFVPQSWKEDAIARNSDQAIAGFARYFYDESMSATGRTPITPLEAREKAERLVQKLVDERGVMIPREAYQAVGGKADTLDYQRLIRLEQPWAKEAATMLEPFLETNLRATLGKYFHTTSARLSFVDRFGVRGHAVDDYLNARFAGKEVVKEILEKGRSMYRMAKVATDNGVMHSRDEVPLIGGLDHETAASLTDQLYAIAGSDLASRKQAMVDLIVATHDEKTPHLHRRADALAQAVIDNPTGEQSFDKVATQELQFVEGFVDSIEGRNTGGPYLAIARRASSAVKAINNVRLLGFTTLTSLSDPAFILGRSGDLKAFTAGLARAATDPDLRQMMRNVGLGADALVQQHMSYLHGTGPSRFAQAFFRMNGLTSWTGFMREFAGVVGWESIKSAQRRAARNLKPNGIGNLTYRQSKRFLEDLGLHDFVPRPDNMSPQSLDDRDLLANNETVRRALLRFGNEAVFSPNKNDTPHWVAAVPFADLLWQLKTFPVMAGRHARYLGREFSQGNPWPALYMLTLGVGMAGGAQSAKDIIQSRGGEEWEGPQATLRDRSLSKLGKEVGVGVNLAPETDAALGWYLQSLVALGAFGAMFDIVYNYAQAADNGSFGAQRFAGQLFGPSVSGFFDAFNVAGGAVDALTKESWEPNAKRRTAVRTMVGNVPILGGSRLVREKTTDAIAGEANR